MKFLEKNLEQIIYEAGSHKLKERGLPVPDDHRFLRQYPLPGYGILDLLSISVTYNPTYDSYFATLMVYELKQEVINTATLQQVARYIKAIRRATEDITGFVHINICGRMIGRSFDHTGDFMHLASMVENIVDIYTYDYSFDGIKFNYVDPGLHFSKNENLSKAFDDLDGFLTLYAELAKHNHSHKQIQQLKPPDTLDAEYVQVN